MWLWWHSTDKISFALLRESLKAQGALLEDNGTQAACFLQRIEINDRQMMNSNNDKKFHWIVTRFYKLAFPPLLSRKSERIHSQKQLRSQSGPYLQVFSSHSKSICTQILGSLKGKLLYCKSISYPVRQELKPLLLLVERIEPFAMTTCFLVWFTASAVHYGKNPQTVAQCLPSISHQRILRTRDGHKLIFVSEHPSKVGPVLQHTTSQATREMWETGCGSDPKKGTICLRDVDFFLSDKWLFLDSLHNDSSFLLWTLRRGTVHLSRTWLILYRNSWQMRSSLGLSLEWQRKQLMSKWISH